MNGSKLRRKIAWEAARLIYHRHETQYYRAKMRAARQLHPGTIQTADLPENSEIRAQIRNFARLDQQQVDLETLHAQRAHAYHVMTQLRPFQPRLVGPALTGGPAPPELIDVYVFADLPAEIWPCLDAARIDYTLAEMSCSPAAGYGPTSLPTEQAVLHGRYPILLSVFPQRMAPAADHRSISGHAQPHATVGQLRQILQRESPEVLEPTPLDPAPFLSPDRFGHYQSLLAPLETVQQPRHEHPEGDALYHSLQVFELGREASPYDEEFLLAALLHDVGKAIDQRDPLAATLDSLQGWVPDRSLWLIEHLPEAHLIQQQTIGMRAHRRLHASDDFDDLMLLARCDLQGRRRGVLVPDTIDALDYLRQLEQMCGD